MPSGVRVIQCDICKQPVSGLVNADIVVWGLVVCTSCCERVPEKLMNRFLESAAWPNEIYYSQVKKENTDG
jgi:hypothetical protein